MRVPGFIGRQGVAVDALRQLATADWGGPGRPGVVAYLPNYSGNPYQRLLYSRMDTQRLLAVPMADEAEAERFVAATQDLDVDRIVHVHWLNQVTRPAGDAAAATGRATEFADRVAAMKQQGARVLWTLHNVLPHDSRFPDADLALRRAMTSLADQVHLMSARTLEQVTPHWPLPAERTFVVAHPSYAGVYPQWMSRTQARRELGIPDGVTVFLLIGALKEYKGGPELLAAFDALNAAEPGRYLLVVAGKPADTDELRAFAAQAEAHPAVLAYLRTIADADLQVFLRAADVGVFPYRRSLNSGAVALALTFGLPVVLPSHSGETDNVTADFAEVYDASTDNGLLDALRRSVRLASHEARAAAEAAAEVVSPARIATQFASAVRQRLNL